jgi:hypothetical protein
MKHIKDLTNEQLAEIATLLFPWFDEKIGDAEIFYSNGMTNYGFGETPDDSGEFQLIKFNYQDHTYLKKIRCYILPDLSCSINYFVGNEINGKIQNLPVRNQYKIQELFREWEIKPKF